MVNSWHRSYFLVPLLVITRIIRNLIYLVISVLIPSPIYDLLRKSPSSLLRHLHCTWHAPRYEPCILLTRHYVLRTHARSSEFLASSSSSILTCTLCPPLPSLLPVVSSFFCDLPWVKLSHRLLLLLPASLSFPLPRSVLHARRIDFDGILAKLFQCNPAEPTPTVSTE